MLSKAQKNNVYINEGTENKYFQYEITGESSPVILLDPDGKKVK